MAQYEIGIVDTRNVVKVLLEDFGLDFRDYALTSFKRRLGQVISTNGLRDADALISRLQQNKEFINQFLLEITPRTTEMFRDPSFWRILRDEVLPEVVRSSVNKPRIWVASFDSGEELYSLAIMLKEMNLLDSVQVYANVLTEKSIARIKSGRLDPKDQETNEANYQRLNGKFSYSSYYKMDGCTVVLDTELVKHVNFILQKTDIENDPGAIKLAIFRNQTIYYNQQLQEKVLQRISAGMVPGGFLALGVKETLESTNAYTKFTVFNDGEKIYKRKTT